VLPSKVFLGNTGSISLCLPESGDLHSDAITELFVEIFAVAEKEQDLDMNEEGSQDRGAHDVIQHGRGSSLSNTMTNELHDPRKDMQVQSVPLAMFAMSIRSRSQEHCHHLRKIYGCCNWLESKVVPLVDDS